MRGQLLGILLSAEHNASIGKAEPRHCPIRAGLADAKRRRRGAGRVDRSTSVISIECVTARVPSSLHTAYMSAVKRQKMFIQLEAIPQQVGGVTDIDEPSGKPETPRPLRSTQRG
eukprot:4434988-Pleurochrysis_carterae.AAC.1